MTRTLIPDDGQSSKDPVWTIFIDGSFTSLRSGTGVIPTSPEGFKVQQAIRFGFMATNNILEYEALLAGLKLAHSLKVKNLLIYSYSQLVVKQMLREYEAREAHL